MSRSVFPLIITVLCCPFSQAQTSSLARLFQPKPTAQAPSAENVSDALVCRQASVCVGARFARPDGG
jgi:hypothetical protein